MVTFKFKVIKDIHRAFIELLDMIRAHTDKYVDAQVGPFNNNAREYLGIIIDGPDEQEVSDDFENIIKEKKWEFERFNDYGVLFYKDRSF